MALLLLRTGEMKAEGFDCANCELDPALKAWRGHGRKPRDTNGNVTWDSEAWKEEQIKWAEEAKQVTPAITGKAASYKWLYANWQESWDTARFLWDACPMWWARHYRGALLNRAMWVVDIALAVEDGFTEGLIPSNGLPLWASQWVKLARIWLRGILNRQQERQIEEAKSNSSDML